MRVATINYQGKDYATVPARLKEFREANPRASIDTAAKYHEDGSVSFKATIIKDLSDEYSAKGSGHAHYSAKEMDKAKAYEKLETIAVGRALANIGYLNDGQIATTEEMQEFLAFKEEKVEMALSGIESASSIEELKAFFLSLGNLMADPRIISAKDAKKAELSKVTA